MKRALTFVAVLAVIGVAVAVWTNYRNGLTAQLRAIHAEWPNVATALERRAELVSGMAHTVGMATHDQDPVFGEIDRARMMLVSGSTAQEKIAANEQLMQAWARLYLLAERYPKLATDADYRRMDGEMKDAENAVALERRKYNELLEHYNAQLQRFPDNVVAKLEGLSRVDDYVITEEEVK